MDARIIVMDSRRAQRDFSWKPRRDVHQIATDVYGWLRENESTRRGVLA